MTSASAIQPESAAASDGSSLGVLRIPYVFTQDSLLRSGEFVRAAEERGLTLSLRELEELAHLGLLVPLFRVDDTVDADLAVDCPWDHYSDLAFYARRGQIRDPAAEGPKPTWPYEPPEGAPDSWWDGFYYSRWQLLTVRQAQSARAFIEYGDRLESLQGRTAEGRHIALALSALAPRHYPFVWGQTSLPHGVDQEGFGPAQYEVTDAPRLTVVGFPIEQLRPVAETLLLRAHQMDPLIDLWPLLRHSNYLGWKTLKGASLLALEHRIAAEVLLRAHEHLAEDGELEALPAPPRQGWFQALHDRIAVRGDGVDSLERALGRFGLSPYPRVLLLVEGETERLHVSRLLHELGIDQPHQVRLHVAESSGANPRMLADYVVSPRLGPVLSDRRLIEATPTALFVAMDPENLWKPATGAKTLDKLKGAVREAVERQGASIEQEELDALVHLYVWGRHSYELANFTNDQLLNAIEQQADERGVEMGDRGAWRQGCAARLEAARADPEVVDISHVKGGFGFTLNKRRLAELLLPVVLDALHGADGPSLPVIEMMTKVHEVYARLSGSGYSLRQHPDPRRDVS